MGLPDLQGTDLIRVTQANCLYTFVCRLVRLAKSLGVAVSIENPGNSWMWCLPPFLDLFTEVAGETVYFHACMHGGTRDKLTCFWCTDNRFNKLAAACSKDHRHESWKPRIVQGKPVFPTASEAAYPVLLCHRMTELIRCAVTALPPQISLFGPAPSHLRLALEKQPRKRRPLVSLYAEYDAWALPIEQHEPLQRLLKCYPKGAKATSRKLCNWGQVRASVCRKIDASKLIPALTSAWTWCVDPDPQEFLPAFDSETSVRVCGVCAPSNFVETCEVVWIGIPHEREAFLALAVKAGHPRMLVSSVEDPVLDTLVHNLLQPKLDDPSSGMALLSELESEKHV